MNPDEIASETEDLSSESDPERAFTVEVETDSVICQAVSTVDLEYASGNEVAPLDQLASLPAEALVSSPEALLQAIETLGSQLTGRLDQLQAAVERDRRAEENREKIVDRLHAELQEYKHDLLLRMMKPVFIDLIQLHDDLGKMIEAQDADKDRSRLSGLQQAIEDILYRQGVEPFEAEGEVFDPRRQRAVSTVPTEEVDRNKTIAARLRRGFQSADKVIRPEIVSVHALKKA